MEHDLTALSVRGPLVSIVLPSYNHARFVEQALASVVGQTYPHWELVVVDDGSTDGSAGVIRTYVGTLGADVQARIRIVEKDNGGVSAALNTALALTSGSLICTLASDDWYAPTKLERQVALFASGPADMGLVHTQVIAVDADGLIVGSRGSTTPSIGHCFEDILTLRSHVVAPTSMFRREVLDRVGLFDEALVCEDLDFLVRIAHAGFSFGFDNEPLFYKREDAGSLGNRLERWWRDIVTVLDKYRPDLDQATFARYDRAVAGALVRMASLKGDAPLAREIARAFVPRIGWGPVAPLLARVALRSSARAAIPEPVWKRLRRFGSPW